MSEGRPDATIPQPLGMFARELMVRATEYRDAATKLDVGANKHLLHPAYFLLSHSVELALKSFLAARGVSKRELRERPLAHNLRALADKATELGLCAVDQLDDLLWHLCGLNEDHALRYPSGYIVSVPYADQCLAIIGKLIEAAKPAVDTAHLKAYMRYLASYQGKYVRWSD